MFYTEEEKKLIRIYINNEIQKLHQCLTMKEPEKAYDIKKSTENVSFEYLIRKLYREVFNQPSSQRLSNRVTLERKLKDHFQHKLNLRNKQIDKLSKEVKKLKEIVREVTDYVYRDGEQ